MTAPAKLLTMSQPFQDPKGVLVNGNLMLTLSQAATVTASGGIVAPMNIYLPLTSGKIANTAVWFSDELSPSGTVYRGVVYGTNGCSIIPGLDSLSYSFTGAGPFDLSTAVQSATASPSYSGAVLLTPTGNQTITTGNLTLTTGNIALPAGTLSLGGGTALATTNRTGTGNLVLASSPTIATPTLTSPTISSATMSSTGGLVPSKQVFIANGTFTIPTGVTAVKVTLVGAGGAGGGATAANVGSGGGSGGIAIKYLSGLTPGNTIAVVVGAGGTGVSAAAGNNGAASTIASGTQTITTVTANPGLGGASQSAVPEGGGGGAAISTNGDINGAGVPGHVAYSTAAGSPGGATFLGGPGTVVGGSTAGNAAVVNTGSGGGGAGSGANNAGGNGGSGIVIFEWTN